MFYFFLVFYLSSFKAFSKIAFIPLNKKIVMSYLKSDFSSSLKPSSPWSFSSDSGDSMKSLKAHFSNLKNLKQNNINSSKTPPLILFVNLLMKHGKKNHALRVLSMTLSLFKARITKIKVEKLANSLKNKKKRACKTSMKDFKYFFKAPWQSTFSRNLLSNYSIKAQNFTLVLFSKKGNSNYSTASNSILYFPFFKYKKGFPFSYNFYNLFEDFYARRKFFCGKFLNLKQFKNIKKLYMSFFCEGEINKYFFFKEGAYCSVPSTLINSRVNLFRFKPVLLSQGKKKILFYKARKKRQKVSRGSKGGVWYKTLHKNPSWDKLTTPQKNTFLCCLFKAISNVKPPLECRTKRIGGSNKQIPSQVSEHRQWGIAIRWIIEAAQKEFAKKKNKKGFGVDGGPKKPFFNYNLEPFKSIVDPSRFSKFPRGMLYYLESLPSKNKYSFLSSLFQGRTSKGGSLRDSYPKTKFYCFSFFLAESLENAYYKRGPAMQKRNLWIETALTNRAFLRYRWW